MTDNPSSPLLGASSEGAGSRSPSRSHRSNQSTRSVHLHLSSESTPLLSRDEREHGPSGDEQGPEEHSSNAASSLRSLQGRPWGKSSKGWRWPSILALALLTVFGLAIIIIGFFAPAIVEDYADKAVDFTPTNLSIDSFTAKGVRARVQGTLVVDASRVRRASVRNIGRACTWIAKSVESKKTKLRVYLPEDDDVLLGTAVVPPIVVNIRNGHRNHIDFLTDLEPGDVEGIRRVANDWLEGRLGQLRVQGKADVGLKSGIFSLGTQKLSEFLVFKGRDIPTMPEHNVTRLNFHEVKLPDGSKGMEADASVTISNDYPVNITIPPLGFDILVPNCVPEDPYILIADATTDKVDVSPRTDVDVSVKGIIREFPEQFMEACPGSQSSPFDLLLSGYLHGKDTTVYVRGSDSPSPETPDWIASLTSSVTLPFPFSSHEFDNLIKNFSLTDVHFSLPSPGQSEHPTISATVKALIALPKEMNFPINVSQVRADADVFFHGEKLGRLDLHDWQEANSTRTEPNEEKMAFLLVQSAVDNAPMEITDDDVFAELVQALIFGGKPISLGITANVDVRVNATLGEFTIKDIPAKGAVNVKPISGVGSITPKVGSLKILDTGESMLRFQALLNFTNPTAYFAKVPYVNINILRNETVLGNATARNLMIVPGANDNVIIDAFWDPLSASGKEGEAVGRDLLSEYISGFNTTLILKTHKDTIPSQPALGRALAAFHIELQTPHLGPPDKGGDGDGEDGDDAHFLSDATMHLLTSTATFSLHSPLHKSTFFITHINATAFFNHTEDVGDILYDLPFAVPPGTTQTPRLPVDWSLGSVGYDAIKSALGGQLKLDANATVGIRLEHFTQTVWFQGKGIGAKVRV
ncbi:MAG: hypothetical protein M1833_005280 [Piccolia ochrophora]|nr:MAG: hypothetical protein M1833_005280 [Piccolia ochrophora]